MNCSCIAQHLALSKKSQQLFRLKLFQLKTIIGSENVDKLR